VLWWGISNNSESGFRIQDFDDQTMNKKYSCNVQATEEAFSPQKWKAKKVDSLFSKIAHVTQKKFF
jgi:hypothetical protein